MEGNNTTLIWLKNAGTPLEVTTTMENGTDDKTGVFFEKKCFTYTLRRRLVSLEIALMGNKADSTVNNVLLNLSEKNGKGSSVNLNLHIMRNDKYGVLCRMTSNLVGAFNLSKDHFYVPPLPNTELLHYKCNETGLEGFFTLEKKLISNEFVGRVKATHAFVVGDETMNVKMKITYDKRVGLIVEVEDPLRLTVDYMNRVSLRTELKAESEMKGGMNSLYRNVINLSRPDGKSKDRGGGDRQVINGSLHARTNP